MVPAQARPDRWWGLVGGLSRRSAPVVCASRSDAGQGRPAPITLGVSLTCADATLNTDKEDHSGEAEAFHLIRAHLRYFNVDRELRTLLVASAAPGDGKTTVARHLAAAAARMGSRVLLLEADLRRPTIALQLDVASGPGVADVLIGAVSLSEATQMVGLDLPGSMVLGAGVLMCWWRARRCRRTRVS